MANIIPSIEAFDIKIKIGTTEKKNPKIIIE